jgi:hypothetical protein
MINNSEPERHAAVETDAALAYFISPFVKRPLYGWFLEAGGAGDFQKASDAFKSAAAIVDRLTNIVKGSLVSAHYPIARLALKVRILNSKLGRAICNFSAWRVARTLEYRSASSGSLTVLS